jgi:hypothetical protein
MIELDIIENKCCPFCHQGFVFQGGFLSCPDYHMRICGNNLVVYLGKE